MSAPAPRVDARAGRHTSAACEHDAVQVRPATLVVHAWSWFHGVGLTVRNRIGERRQREAARLDVE
jgi:hypothetical protein